MSENKKVEFIPVAIDGGNNEIKIIVNEKPYFIKSIIKKVYESRLVYGTDQGEPINFLDVDIKINGIEGNFYAGELALSNTNSASIESLGGYKSDNDMLIAEMIIGLSYALVDQYPDRTEYDIKLGTGLPTHEFFYRNKDGIVSFEKVKSFTDKLRTTHKVKFNTDLLRKKSITINVAKVIPNPECHSALYRLLANPNIKEMYPELFKKNINILGLDIGGGSSDVSGICNGKYIEQAMFGIDRGINKALDKTSEIIRNKANLKSFNRYDLNNYLFDPDLKGILETNKGKYDLNTEKIPYYRGEAEAIVLELKKRLNERGFSLNMVHALFLLGGASIELGDMVADLLRADIPKILKASEFVSDPRLLNVEAYYDAVVNL